MTQKQKIIAGLIIVALIVFLAGLLWPRGGTGTPVPQTSLTPTPTATPPPISYDRKSTKKMEELLKKKQRLSPADQTVKESLKGENNPLFSNENVQVAYNPKTDSFDAQINTIRINTAKEEAISWLKAQGLSDDAICKIPVVFTISEKEAESLRGLDIIFNPLPPGCTKQLGAYARSNSASAILFSRQ